MTKLNKERRGVFAGITNRETEKKLRKILKNIEKHKLRNVKDPYAVSLMDEPRKGCGSFDGYVEYGLYELSEEQERMTEQELRDEIYEAFAIPEWNSPYDCTGKAFTEYISFHKNPCGLVSIIHHVGIDV